MIADDGYALRAAIGPLLESEPGLQLVATCADGDELLAAVGTFRPAVVVSDLGMASPDRHAGVALANRLRDTHPEVGVVLVSESADPRSGAWLVEHGAEGRAYLLLKHVHERDYLVKGLRAVAEAGSMIDPEVVDALIAASLRSPHSPPAELSERELEVLGRALAALGLTGASDRARRAAAVVGRPPA